MKGLLPLLCALLGACHVATDITKQLTVSLYTDREIVSATTPVSITISLVNHGDREIQTSDPHTYDCDAPYFVVDSLGREISLPARICTLASYSPLTLAPGDSVVIHDRWSGTMGDGSVGAIPVVAGRYRIVARVFAASGIATSDAVEVRVDSATPR
jgi:ABC-type Fe3+-hydroxamate transport system substrate-binding protein